MVLSLTPWSSNFEPSKLLRSRYGVARTSVDSIDDILKGSPVVACFVS